MAESVAAITTVVDRHKVCRVGYGSARAPGGGRMRRAGGLAAVTPHRCHRRHPHPPAAAPGRDGAALVATLHAEKVCARGARTRLPRAWAQALGDLLVYTDRGGAQRARRAL